jgi:hypothetical protein
MRYNIIVFSDADDDAEDIPMEVLQFDTAEAAIAGGRELLLRYASKRYRLGMNAKKLLSDLKAHGQDPRITGRPSVELNSEEILAAWIAELETSSGSY